MNFFLALFWLSFDVGYWGLVGWELGRKVVKRASQPKSFSLEMSEKNC